MIVAATLSSIVASARAEGEIEIAASGCDLRQDELERLIRLELGAVVRPEDEVSGYRVEIACAGDEVQLRIEDPLTRKSLERTVEAPGPAVPEPERMIALSVAQLYRAAWLELVAEDPAPLPPKTPPPEAPRAKRAARAVVQPTIEAGEPETNARMHVRLGVAARGVQHDTVMSPALGAGFGYSPAESLRVGVGVQFEAGAEQRTTGRIQARMAGMNLRLAYEPRISHTFVADLDVEGGLLFTSLHGSDVGPGLVAGNVEGIAFDASLGAGIGADLDPVRVGAALRAGVVTGAPLGYVEGDETVDLNGPWVGGFANAGFRF